MKKMLHPVLFTLAGMLLGFCYYYFVGCGTGSCAITANPLNSMIYLGVMGLLISGIFEKGSCATCNM